MKKKIILLSVIVMLCSIGVPMIMACCPNVKSKPVAGETSNAQVVACKTGSNCSITVSAYPASFSITCTPKSLGCPTQYDIVTPHNTMDSSLDGSEVYEYNFYYYKYYKGGACASSSACTNPTEDESERQCMPNVTSRSCPSPYTLPPANPYTDPCLE